MFADHLYCKLVFDSTGIHMSTEKLSAADFYSRLSAGLEPSKTSASVLASTGLIFDKQTLVDQSARVAERPAVKGKKPKSGKPSKVGEMVRLTAYFDRFAAQNIILVRHGRITHMAFEAVAQNGGWLFVDNPNVFRLKDGASDEDRAKFTSVDVVCDRRVMLVTYTPDADSGGKLYDYELRLQAAVWTPNDTVKPSSYVTIIVDPIIGNEEV